MTKPVKSLAHHGLILFGLSPIGKPRAGAFKGTDLPAARKAAAKLGLSILEVTDQAGLALAAKVPAGRIGQHHDKVVPFIAKDLYGEIETLAGPRPKGGTAAGTSLKANLAQLRLPNSWDDIKVGDLVLAQDSDPADGWWQAIVVDHSGDLFKLRWPRSERGRLFQKHRLTLGLICPGGGGQDIQGQSKTPSSGSVFPASWAAIGPDQIVLAKEDGPAEQWWEAKTIELDKDQFTLQWCDYPTLPPIVRPRLALALLHPNPAGASAKSTAAA